METPNSISEETIFSAALQHAPEERAAYLDRACAGNAAFRSRVEALLNAQPQLGSFMEVPIERIEPASQGALRFALAPEERPGTCIGRYKLLQKLGEGGCGVVYMAEQEEPVRRRVALKVIKLGMDTKSVIARFEAERQALAMMDHPNIAKVLDAGATETGRPYFVMELVRGTKITHFCDQNRLATRERLELFVQVCHAVQHAHQKGIIHRDLKPSNILVTMHDPGSPPVPKVIDFGIAKATQGRLTDQTLFTAFEQFLGTPAYMSPEQALMTVLDVDTRSDIYSLGVLLYELLTGSTPFNSKELLASGLEEMRRTIREKEPPRPSTRLSTLMAGEQVTAASYRQTEAPKLIHLVRGDLDWIVMKCLEKDRARRYETANALVVDLRRHLSNEPITARPPSRFYEFQKTVRRHKLGFAAATAVILALTAGVAVSAWQAMRARREQRRAEHNLYVADMRLAQQALAEGNSDGTRRLLARYLPPPGGQDLRGWEWRYLASASQSDESGRLPGHRAWVRDLCFLADGQLLSVGFDRQIIWWNWPQRTANYTLTNAPAAWKHALSPDGRTLALVGPFQVETNVYLLDTKTRDIRPLPLPTQGERLTLAYSPVGELAIGSNGRVSLWDGKALKPLLSLPPERSAPDLLRFSPEGKRLAVATRDGWISVWNVASGQLLTAWQAHEANTVEAFGALRFSPDGMVIISTGVTSDRKVCVWDPDTGRLITTLEGHRHVASRAGVLDLAFSRDGAWLATAGADQTVRVWDAKTWKMERALTGHSEYVYAVAWSPDGHLVSANSSGELLVWNWPAEKTRLEGIEFTNQSLGMTLSRQGNLLIRPLVRQEADFAEVWDPRTLQLIDKIRTQPYQFRSVEALSDGRAVMGEANGKIRLWERVPQPGRETQIRPVTEAESGSGGVSSILRSSQDGRLLVSAGGRDVRVWTLPKLAWVGSFRLDGEIRDRDLPTWPAAALAGDGSRVAFLRSDDRVEARDLPRGGLVACWQADVFGSACLALSADGCLLATGSKLGTGGIWALPGPRFLGALESNPVTVTAMAFSPDGSRLAVGLLDGTVKLLEAHTAAELVTFRKHSEPIQALAFVPDGTELISVSSDALCIWRAPGLRDLTGVVELLAALRRPVVP